MRFNYISYKVTSSYIWISYYLFAYFILFNCKEREKNLFCSVFKLVFSVFLSFQAQPCSAARFFLAQFQFARGWRSYQMDKTISIVILKKYSEKILIAERKTDIVFCLLLNCLDNAWIERQKDSQNCGLVFDWFFLSSTFFQIHFIFCLMQLLP